MPVVRDRLSPNGLPIAKTDLQVFRTADRYRPQTGRGGRKLQYREIIVRRRADKRRRYGLPGVQPHRDTVGSLHHVKVRHYMPRAVPDEAGSRPASWYAWAEHARGRGFREDVDHGRAGGFEQLCRDALEARQVPTRNHCTRFVRCEKHLSDKRTADPNRGDQ